MLSDPRELEFHVVLNHPVCCAGNPSCGLWKGGVPSLSLLSRSLNFYSTSTSFFEGAHSCHCTHVEVTGQLGEGVSFLTSATCVPGIEFRLSGLATGALTVQLSH